MNNCFFDKFQIFFNMLRLKKLKYEMGFVQNNKKKFIRLNVIKKFFNKIIYLIGYVKYYKLRVDFFVVVYIIV